MIKTFYVKTYGCIMNYSDSDKIRAILKYYGLQEVSKFEEADVIILNSCSVRQQAEDKILGWAKKLKDHKPIVILTGCMATRERGFWTDGEKYRGQIKRKYPWIDIVLDIRQISELPVLLKLDEVPFGDSDYLNLFPSNIESGIIAKLPISTGCDFFCTYCIVPFSRGAMVHRPYEKILDDASKFLKQGSKLIYLIGQNVNSWEADVDGKQIRFDSLLNGLSKLDGDFWITFVSSNPMDFSDEMIEAIAENKKIVRWLNLAVQSGSNKILQKMNRRYTVEKYLELVKKIKSKVPDIRLTTDIIVGFPEETEEDFKQTLDLVQNVEFEMVYIGKYSPRHGTVAERVLEDNIPLEVKKERFHRLESVVNEIRLRKHKEYVGKHIDMLVTGSGRAISYYNHDIIFNNPQYKPGNFYSVEVEDFSTAGISIK